MCTTGPRCGSGGWREELLLAGWPGHLACRLLLPDAVMTWKVRLPHLLCSLTLQDGRSAPVCPQCPFAHPQEKARRRDPSVHNYTGIACPSMKKARAAGRWGTAAAAAAAGAPPRTSATASAAAAAGHRQLPSHVPPCWPPTQSRPPLPLLAPCQNAAPRRPVRPPATIPLIGAAAPPGPVPILYPRATAAAGGLLRVWRPLPLRPQRV